MVASNSEIIQNVSMSAATKFIYVYLSYDGYNTDLRQVTEKVLSQLAALVRSALQDQDVARLLQRDQQPLDGGLVDQVGPEAHPESHRDQARALNDLSRIHFG